MRLQPFVHHRLPIMLLIAFYVLLSTMLVTAQDEPPAPQFLYRNENRLVLLNGYTGEATELPFEVVGGDHFTWSPDGRYLLALLQDDEPSKYCLNLYDVDVQVWVYNKPIACAVGIANFSADGARRASRDGHHEGVCRRAGTQACITRPARRRSARARRREWGRQVDDDQDPHGRGAARLR